MDGSRPNAHRDSQSLAAADDLGSYCPEQLEELKAKQRERVLDYKLQSLAKSSPLEATLGAINGDLMNIGLRLGEVVEQTLAEHPHSLHAVERVAAAMQTHLQTVRQIERLTQVQLRLADQRRSRREAREDRNDRRGRFR